jgi:hypothetical protein
MQLTGALLSMSNGFRAGYNKKIDAGELKCLHETFFFETSDANIEPPRYTATKVEKNDEAILETDTSELLTNLAS